MCEEQAQSLSSIVIQAERSQDTSVHIISLKSSLTHQALYQSLTALPLGSSSFSTGLFFFLLRSRLNHVIAFRAAYTVLRVMLYKAVMSMGTIATLHIIELRPYCMRAAILC